MQNCQPKCVKLAEHGRAPLLRFRHGEGTSSLCFLSRDRFGSSAGRNNADLKCEHVAGNQSLSPTQLDQHKFNTKESMKFLKDRSNIWFPCIAFVIDHPCIAFSR